LYDCTHIYYTDLSRVGENSLRGPACKICGAATLDAGSKTGKWKKRAFHLRRCPECCYAFISDHLTDFAAIYSAEYYNGRGVDPLVDYVFELECPGETIRVNEWRGVRQAVDSLVKLQSHTNWLDFGCGNGGLVRFCRDDCRIVGFETGWICDKSREHGIPILTEDELAPLAGSFDIVTAIEVLEHVEDPLEVLHGIRRLLKPGGLFFYTTGNARPHRKNLIEWPYVLPETHISIFEPDTLARALRDTGFRPEFRGYLPGHTDIIRFKVLKNLRLFKRAAWQDAVPWDLLGRTIDWRLKITGHPIAWAV
jgi:SAM-dependent methyltransferase